RVAQCSADAIYLVGVDALADVALDREIGQVDVGGTALVGAQAVETDASVDRAVRRRRAQCHLVALENGVPAARAFDRHVVNDDVLADRVDAWRYVDRQMNLL